MNGNLIYDALEDDEELVVQYMQSLSEWDFAAAGQMIQVEDSSTNETLHVSVSEAMKKGGDVEFTIGDDVILPNKRHKSQ